MDDIDLLREMFINEALSNARRKYVIGYEHEKYLEATDRIRKIIYILTDENSKSRLSKEDRAKIAEIAMTVGIEI